MNICIVIPAHNESPTIGRVIDGCKQYTNNILVIDDGSTDNTSMVAKSFGAGVFGYGTNLGYGSAIKSGLYLTKYFDCVITIDADGQHNPNDIPKLINAIRDGYDVVIGSRFYRGNRLKIPLYRRFGIWMITEAYNLGHKPIHDAQSGFRAFSKKFVNSINLVENGFGSTIEILVKARKQGFKITEVPISCTYHNLEQDSHMNPFKQGFDVIKKTIEWRLKERN